MNVQFAPLVIGVVMLSLGLSLTVADFRRAAEIPRPIAVALFCQAVLLPAICFLIANLFSLPPVLAVGLMLVAAAPGGAFANIFSHLADGDLALNLTLTAINSLLSIATLPLIVALSIAYFMGQERTIPLQYGKVIQIFALIVVPVAVGMLLRHRFPVQAERLRGATKLVAGIFVLLVGALALITGWETVKRYFAILGIAVIVLNIVSLIVGYSIPRMMHLGRNQAIAISCEIGLHNGALAITIAASPQLLGNSDMAVPAALYGSIMPFVAAGFLWVINRINRDAYGPSHHGAMR